MRRLGVALVLLAAATIPTAPGFAFDEVFQQTYALPAGGSFQLQNVNGSVQVSGWERDAVEVYAVKTTQGNPKDLERVSIEVQAQEGSVTVQTHYPQDDGVEVYVEYHIRVPQRIDLRQVATVNGAVRVFGVEASGELRSVNGDIEVFDSSGRLSVHTTNGNVRLELHRVEGSEPMSVETMNGSVLLALPNGAGAELDVRILNGDFRSELPVTLQGSSGAREFRARLGPGGSPLRMRTVNGAIRLVALRPMV